MDELEFRRRLFADPHDEEVIAAAKAQPELQRIVTEMQQFDEFLNQSMAIEVPDDLADKIIAKQKAEVANNQEHGKVSWFRRATMPFAVAASTLFAALIFYFGGFGEPLNTGQHALAHVYHESSALEREDAISLQQVNEKLAMFGGKFDDLPGKVVFATFCNFKGQKSLHLVMQSEFGPLTVFVVPTGQQATLDGSDQFSDNRFSGLIAYNDRANTILVGDKSAPLQHFQSAVQTSLRWL